METVKLIYQECWSIFLIFATINIGIVIPDYEEYSSFLDFVKWNKLQLILGLVGIALGVPAFILKLMSAL